MQRSAISLTLVFAAWLVAAVEAQQPTAKGKTRTSPALKPDPLALKPGDPLSVRALVTRPPTIKGVVSWSLETRKHRSYISTTALSPDGKLYATGGIDGTIRIWQTANAKLVRALLGHNSYCYGLAFSPDGKMLASAGSYDNTVRLWDVQSGMPLRILKGHQKYAVQVAWAPDGRLVAAAGGESGTVSYWDVATGKHQGSTDLGRPIRGLAWHPEGKRVAIVAPLVAVALWDVEQNKIVESFGAANAEFHAVAWTPDGKTLAAGAGSYVFLFDEAGKELKKLPGHGYALAWSTDGKTLASADIKAGRVHVWTAETGAKVKELETTAYTLAYLPGDQQLVASGSYSFGIIDMASGKLDSNHVIAGTDPPLWWMNRPIVTGSGSVKLSLWDQTSGRLLRHLEGHKSGITAVAWAPDGKVIATAAHDKTVKLWESATGKELRTLEGHTAPVQTLAFANDGKLIASGGDAKLVLIHDSGTGALVQTLKGHNDPVRALAWAPGASGLLVSGSSDKSARLWNPKAGAKEVRALVDDSAAVVCAGWSPDGKIVITGHDDHRARTWQASTGKLLHVLEVAGSPPQVSALAWSPNDVMLACGRGNHTLQLWSTKTAELYRSVPTLAPVVRVSWTPGSSTVIASNADRTARFYDAATGQVRATLLAEEKQLIAVSFDGHYRSDGTLTNELLIVAQLDKSQESFLPAQFAAKFHFKNVPGKVVLVGK